MHVCVYILHIYTSAWIYDIYMTHTLTQERERERETERERVRERESAGERERGGSDHFPAGERI